VVKSRKGFIYDQESRLGIHAGASKICSPTLTDAQVLKASSGKLTQHPFLQCMGRQVLEVLSTQPLEPATELDPVANRQARVRACHLREVGDPCADLCPLAAFRKINAIDQDLMLGRDASGGNQTKQSTLAASIRTFDTVQSAVCTERDIVKDERTPAIAERQFVDLKRGSSSTLTSDQQNEKVLSASFGERSCWPPLRN